MYFISQKNHGKKKTYTVRNCDISVKDLHFEQDLANRDSISIKVCRNE